MITDDDVKKLKTIFATKDDLKKYATQKVAEGIVKEVVSLRHDLNDVKENMVTKDDFRQVMTAIDRVYGEVKTYRQEQDTLSQRVTDIESMPIIAHQIKK